MDRFARSFVDLALESGGVVRLAWTFLMISFPRLMVSGPSMVTVKPMFFSSFYLVSFFGLALAFDLGGWVAFGFAVVVLVAAFVAFFAVLTGVGSFVSAGGLSGVRCWDSGAIGARRLRLFCVFLMICSV